MAQNRNVDESSFSCPRKCAHHHTLYNSANGLSALSLCAVHTTYSLCIPYILLKHRNNVKYRAEEIFSLFNKGAAQRNERSTNNYKREKKYEDEWLSLIVNNAKALIIRWRIIMIMLVFKSDVGLK